MLLNLKTIHKPATVEEAAGLLADPGVYPLYGGAALHRANRTDVEAALDLGQLGLDFVRDSENSLRLGSMLSLEAARQACLERRDTHPQLGAVADTLAADLPLTLRNTMTLGDLLVERDPQSLTLTLLLVLGAVIKRVDVDMHFTMAAWLTTDSDVARYLIASSVVAVVAQRLVRKVCRECAYTYEISEAERALLGGEHHNVRYLTRGRGCPVCNGTGYRGRSAVHEIVLIDKTMRDMITKGASNDDLFTYARQGQGMKTLRASATELLLAGLTTADELMRTVYYEDI